MAWDKTLPQDSTKIRNYPTILTDNFKAIEEGDQGLEFWQTRFVDRDSIAIASNPTRADDEMAIFSKDDGTNTELYLMDDQNPANIIQITEAGKLGSSNTEIICSNIQIGSSGAELTQNSLAWAYGFVPKAGGAVSGGQGLGTATINTSGGFTFYRITLTTTPANTNYHVFICTEPVDSSSRLRTGSLKAASRTTGQFDVVIQRTGDSTWRTDVDFHVMVVGGF